MACTGILLMICLNARSQTVYFSQRTAGQPLQFRLLKDSIPNIHPIVDQKVQLKDKVLDLRQQFPFYGHAVMDDYQDYFELYYLDLGPGNENLCVELTFCFGHLTSMTWLAKGHYNINTLKIELQRRFPYKRFDKEYTLQADSVVTYSNPHRRVIYGEHYGNERWFYHDSRVSLHLMEDLKKEWAIVTLSDRRIDNITPGWCRYDRKFRSWEKVKTALKRGQ
ncbi:MAG: hypothetical protein AVDCRST_MAG56-5575 [uncultured Cytophagales bacterium]|uniref:Uncharacterized protein n=1 Tax=uncultured Cytophagales bacterium TaxID=158755 RepID=A0A6J4KCC9_9SPHI|nr:MAG: hypothetical protein AVDCRST_MAG56-5575 [uncultured Cytophagales bacterium]